MTDDDEPLGDKTYEVGYGRPPRATRFQPGRSGNPRGRPKKPKSIQERFERELARKVAVREDGRVRKIPKIDLWVRRVIADAIKGSHQASRILIEMRSASDEEIAKGVAEQTLEELTAEDRAILDRHLAQLTTDAGTAEQGGAE
jgi:hypothetical protein